MNQCECSLFRESWVTILNNKVSGMGGAILFAANNIKYDVTLFLTHCQFTNNSAQKGGALYLESNRIIEKLYQVTNCSFISNRADEGGALYSPGADVLLIYSHLIFNSADNGGALYATKSSSISINENTTVANNVAGTNGGGIYIQNSKLDVDNTSFNENAAIEKGGAIFVDDVDCGQNSYSFDCSISVNFKRHHKTFSNNSAKKGKTLYGGLLDRCCVYNNCNKSGIHYFRRHCAASSITSDPVRVCLCNENSKVDCATRNLTVDKQRGQTINLSVVAADQDRKALKGWVQASYVNFIADFGEGEGRQLAGDYCESMPFHVFTSNDSAVLVLEPEGVCENSVFSSITVDVNIIPCSIGFERKTDRCECDQRLSPYVTSCDVDALTICAKESGIWLQYSNLFLEVHTVCPLDFCSVSSLKNLSSQNEQCANNRSGVICGSCQENYSIALGGSKCLDCSSSVAYAWLIPVFAVAGMALVALLLVCNMTISHGTLNGLIFYANVVSISRLTNFPNCTVHPLLSVFIAWVNLDLGVETCFYPGMDTYQKTWLQFAFPLYILILIGAIILVSHYSTRAVKVFGKNNIAVLATLFLLSYTKLLKTIITALNFTEVLRASASNTSDPLVPYSVWVYDGNIEYLKGKHVPLFAVALAFLVFLFLPYTMLLTFGQCLRSIRSRNKCVLWCIQSTAFVSIMDAYHAPYTNRHRYWTGFMLFVRCVIFLGFATSFDGVFSNVFITLISLVVVITTKSCIKKVYKNFAVDILDVIFLLNLVILSAAVLFFQASVSFDKTLCTCVNASISISFTMFIGILLYHTYVQMMQNKRLKSVKDTLLAKLHSKQYNRIMPADIKPPEATNRSNAPTRSVVKLREELLESAKDENS